MPPATQMIAPGAPLPTVDLPYAPPVITAPPAPLRRPKAPAFALLALGVLLVIGPIVGGLFVKTAAGEQMIDEFAPYMQNGSLARYGTDIATLRAGAAGIHDVYRTQGITGGRYPGLDEFRTQSTAILGRAAGLLDRVRATRPDYQRISGIGGFERIPFLIVACGAVAIYGACVLLAGRRSRARPTVLLVVVASAALVAYPFVSGLFGGAQSGQRMLHTLGPVMTPHEVRLLQDDFVVLVNADGQLDTTFRSVAQPGPSATQITAMVNGWPRISSDLASLVGVINDNIGNFDALDDLDTRTRQARLGGLGTFPWLLVGIGALTAGLALAAAPRRGREPQ
ncbi:MAG: hypothetical protein ABSC41_10255 [Acidimicrobiales bacterium]|jgi:hypothetical protein